MKKYAASFFILFFLLSGLVCAKDFGLVLDQSAGYGGVGDNNNPDYTGVLIPRFSTRLGSNGLLYISAGVAAEYEYEEWSFVPELLRTEFSWLFPSADLKIGRMYYSDPLGFIAEGLFDGARFTYDTTAGSFSAGAWYTGLLYKKRARIAMTSDELLSYYTKVDYGEFVDSYFAPGRVVAALDWEHPNLGRIFRTRLSLLGQFDLTDAELHSQYLTGKISVPLGAFLFDLGGSFELMEASDDFATAFALEAKAAWTLPTGMASRLSFLGRYAGGVMGGDTGAFMPLTFQNQSTVLQPRVPGTTMLSLEYAARFHRSFSAVLSSSYFIRNDLETYTGYPVGWTDESDGHFLGNEFFGRLYWSPVSDILFTVGGGLFMPSMGDAAPDAKNLWRIEAGLVISLY